MAYMELNEDVLELIAGRFRLLSDPTRLKILHTLGDKEMSVTEIVSTTGANQANVSKHLGILLEADVVARRKEGLLAIYKVSDETIFDLCDAVCSRLKTQFENRKNLLTQVI